MLRHVLPYTFVVVLIAAIYAGWSFWSRGRANATFEKKREMDEAKRAAAVVRAYGGDELKILAFYASPATIGPGEKTLLCYGANNAATVQIEPPVGEIAPSL